MIPDSPQSSADSLEEEFRSVDTIKPISNDNSSTTTPLHHEQSSNESIRSWLQRITQMQTEIQKKLSSEQSSTSGNTYADFLVKTTPCTTNQTTCSSSRVMNYQDLPYMGEMTLDNSKPRRGRKPKKADICHLIYKNYGTIYPGTPNPGSLMNKDALKKTENDERITDLHLNETLNRSDVQNRIISSLLEKRLTQESKRNKYSLMKPAKRCEVDQTNDQNEPLNLCIRDLNELKIRLLRKCDDVYPSDRRSESQSDDDVEFVHELQSPLLTNKGVRLSASVMNPRGTALQENGSTPSGYVYWPNAGVFIRPMALQQQLLYYQKLAASNNFGDGGVRVPPAGDNQAEFRKLAPKVKARKSDVSADAEHNHSEVKTKRSATTTSTEKTPTKRKRSAIFIPPIPAENQTNPATEVSICKFKFTGGAKPSLQEKKMLSVDSGGNFRYYSGTGDKSMRGYEFFPRETLQQQVGNSQGSSTGAFLQASGEKIFPVSPADFPGKPARDFMLTPEISPSGTMPTTPELVPRHKKRKSRKSLQREKLEQTFKEKGFLIQTQQLESAEGATYCKFRQLRKFTRYLFRSWKDYLPGMNVESQENERSRENDDGTETDTENLSTVSGGDLTSRDAKSSMWWYFQRKSQRTFALVLMW